MNMKILKKYSGRFSKGYVIKTDMAHNFYVFRYNENLFNSNDMASCRLAVKIFTDPKISSLEP